MRRPFQRKGFGAGAGDERGEASLVTFAMGEACSSRALFGLDDTFNRPARRNERDVGLIEGGFVRSQKDVLDGEA